MLQTLNIPNGPLPEVPSASPGAHGDAGERAEFAHLLRQAKAEPQATHDAPAAPTAKDTCAEPRTRPTTPRTGAEHKPRDVHKTRTDADTDIDTESNLVDLLVCIKDVPRTNEPVPASDSVVEPEALQRGDSAVDTPLPPSVPLPPLMHVSDPAPEVAAAAPSAVAAAAVADERAASGRSGAHIGGRDMRLAARIEAAAAGNADATATRAASQGDPAAIATKDAAIEFALQHPATGRGAAPSVERAPLESNAAAAQAMSLARELPNPLAARAPAPAEATLRAAPDHAGFAPALGTQVAMWVKDGVQEARLQLHPAELGPVTVQITLEGQAAHVDFTAAVAATRESIEQSLPALAAALRESGFTLAGGGVFGRSGQGAGDHGRERTPEGRGHGRRGTAAVGDGEADAAAALPRRWARSLVDVYA